MGNRQALSSGFPISVIRGGALNAALVVISALLASLAFPPHELWPLAWVCLVPLFIALGRTSAVRASGWLALLFGLVFLGFTLRWLTNIFGTGIVGIMLLGSLPFVLFGLAYRFVYARSSPLAAALMTPVLWLAVDWLRCDGWYFRFSWAQLGFTQISWRGGLAFYPLVGVYGVTLLIALVNSGVAALFDRRLGLRTRCGFLEACVAIAAAGVILSFLAQPFHSGAKVIVGAVQDESGDVEALKQLTVGGNPRLRPYLVVWPEYAVYDYPLSKPALLAELRRVARKSGSVLILGCKERAPANAPCDWFRRRAMGDELFYNAALIIGPKGDVLGTYHKTHPIQLFSDGVPGRSYPVFSTPSGRVGVAICYDFDFASSALNLVRNGAEIIVVPTFDPGSWGALQHVQHARMAQARAAEAGRWVVRATSSGVTQIINPGGEVTAQLPQMRSSALSGRAAFRSGLTPYVRVGYLLPYVCAALSAIWLAAPVLRRLSGLSR
ncbi:MAG: nitrilase-related carbon-nitrogen hydrolase [Armatimonadota bacterium]|nr:nitrilase-related carbon-nitrogen hydrolase [Armatimonadota bacterium]